MYIYHQFYVYRRYDIIYLELDSEVSHLCTRRVLSPHRTAASTKHIVQLHTNTNIALWCCWYCGITSDSQELKTHRIIEIQSLVLDVIELHQDLQDLSFILRCTSRLILYRVAGTARFAAIPENKCFTIPIWSCWSAMKNAKTIPPTFNAHVTKYKCIGRDVTHSCRNNNNNNNNNNNDL